MTQPNDPWSAATAAPAQTVPAPEAGQQGAGGMSSAFSGREGGSALFDRGTVAPSLFNKTHSLGTSRSGIIVKMDDVQDRDFNAKLPKYWSLSKCGGPQRNSAVTTDAIDPPTGQKNEPVIVTHITLSTEYRMDAAECVAIGRSTEFVGEDDGTRVDVVGGFDYKPFKEAIADAVGRGLSIRGPKDLIGKRLTRTRVGQKPNPGGNPSWINAFRLDNA